MLPEAPSNQAGSFFRPHDSCRDGRSQRMKLKPGAQYPHLHAGLGAYALGT